MSEKKNQKIDEKENKKNFKNQKNNESEKSDKDESKATDILDITTMAEYKKLEEELMLAKLAAKESMEMVKNFKNDVDRIRSRSEKLNSEMGEKITCEVGSKLLPVFDDFANLEKHIENEALLKGFKGVNLALKGILDSLSIEQIEVRGGVLDPEKMDVVLTESTDDESKDNTVAKVLKNGYYYKPTDKVIRYASVSVYKKD